MAKITFLKIIKLAKGINVYSRDTMLTDEESVEGTNIISTGQYSFKKRPGTALFAEIAGVDQIDGMGTFYTTSGERHLLAMAGGKLYRVDSGTPVEITGAGASWTSGLRTDFCQAGANVFISNGTDTMRQYDGTEATITTNGIVCKHLIFYKQSLYAIGNPSFGSRLYRSGVDDKLGDFTYDDPDNIYATSINISNNDGQDCTSFYKHQDYLYVAKNRSTYRTVELGDDEATIANELVDPARGCDSHFPTDAVENDIFFFNEQGIHSIGYEPNFLSQIRTKILSLRVDSKIKSITKDDLDKTCGLYFDTKYYFAYQKGGAEFNNSILVYDKYRTGWWEYDLSASCFTEFKDSDGETKLYFGSSEDGKVYCFDDTLKSDNGVAFQTRWRSPRYSIADFTQSKFILNVLLYVGRAVGEIDISVKVDNKLIINKTAKIGKESPAGIAVGKIGTFAIGVEGGEALPTDSGGASIIKLPVNKMGRNIEIVIEDLTTNKSWELNSVEIALAKLNKLYQPNVK